ncbi:uncharacterized protein PgNI_00629 [Pyricularia grisea]|uniref:HMG box domain-containing protein n=1 Tax=Pyricularia grisea TaxID=148305 RepID=A0A6P8BID2_PYRGI|nr:uncharacterized protein PgNI_00629 [Pyricularia grisea]TLD16377.1 hypothetical protein PgNI_00629 [Pyricularia grisea]
MRLEAVALLACSALSFALTVPLKPRYIKPEHGVKMKRVILDAPMNGGFVVVGTPAFLNYADANRERIKKASPGANDRQVEELIDKDWEKLSPEAQAEWKNKKPAGSEASSGGPGTTTPKWSNTTTSSGSTTPTPFLGAGGNRTTTSTSTSTSSSTSSSSQTPPAITPAPDVKPGGAGGPPGPTSTSTFSNSTSSTSTSSSSTSSSTSSTSTTSSTSSTSTNPGPTSTGTKTSSTQPPQNGPTGTPVKPGSKLGDSINPEGGDKNSASTPNGNPRVGVGNGPTTNSAKPGSKPDMGDKSGAGTPYGNPGASAGNAAGAGNGGGTGNGPAQLPTVDVGKVGLDGIPQGLPGSWKPELPQDLSAVNPTQPASKPSASLPDSKLPSSGSITKLPPAGLDDKLSSSGPGNKLPADIKINPVRGGQLDSTAKPKPAPIGELDDGQLMINPPSGGTAAPKPKGQSPGPFDDGGSIILTPVVVVGPPDIDGPRGDPPRGISGRPGGMMDDDDHDQMPFGHPGKPTGRGSFPSPSKGPQGKKRPSPAVIGEDTPVTLEDHDDAPLGRKQRGKPTRGGDREVVLEDDDLLDRPLARPHGGKKNKKGPGLISVDIVGTMKHSSWRRDERAQRVRRREVSEVSHDRRHVRHQNRKREQQQHGHGIARG